MNRNFALDGMRGYAALMVTLYHAILMLNLDIIPHVLHTKFSSVGGIYNKTLKVFLLVFNGETAVCLFFILSGFVLFNSLLKQVETPQQLISLSFFIKRITRIYLPLIVCLISFYTIFLILHQFFPTIYGTLGKTALLQNCLLYKITFHGATWTLQVELLAIFFILIAFYGYKKGGSKILVYLTLASIILYDNNFLRINFCQINAWIFYFFLGFICSIFPTAQFEKIIREIGWKIPLIIAIFMRGFINHSSITGILIQALCLAFLLIYLKAGMNSNFCRFLSLPFSAYLGKISYSFYLWNVIFLNLFTPLNGFPLVANHPLEFGLLFGVIVSLVTLPAAHFSEKYIEQLSIKLGKMLSNWAVSLYATRNYSKSLFAP
jgi:peptidoglycan/LPS O-acetylase OafA/YrhL